MKKKTGTPDIFTYLQKKNTKIMNSKKQLTNVNTLNDVPEIKEPIRVGVDPKQLIKKFFQSLKILTDVLSPPLSEVEYHFSQLETAVSKLVMTKVLESNQSMTVQQLLRNLHSIVDDCMTKPDDETIMQDTMKDFLKYMQQEKISIIYSKDEWYEGDFVEAAVLPPYSRLSKIATTVKEYDNYDAITLSNIAVVEEKNALQKALVKDVVSCYKGKTSSYVVIKCFGCTSIYLFCIDSYGRVICDITDTDVASRVLLSKLVLKTPITSQLLEMCNKDEWFLNKFTTELVFSKEIELDYIREEHTHIKQEYYNSILSLAHKDDNTLMPFGILQGELVESGSNTKYVTYKHAVPQVVYNMKEPQKCCAIITPVKDLVYRPQNSKLILKPSSVHICFPGPTTPIVITYAFENDDTVDLDKLFTDATVYCKNILYSEKSGPCNFNLMNDVFLDADNSIARKTKTRDFELYVLEWKKNIHVDYNVQKYGIGKLLKEAIEHIGDQTIETMSPTEFESLVLDYEFNEDAIINDFIQQYLCRSFYINPYFINYITCGSDIDRVNNVCKNYVKNRRLLCFKRQYNKE
jgi:hypothetical protein